MRDPTTPQLTAIRVISMERSQVRRIDFQENAAKTTCEWSFFSACEQLTLPLEYVPSRARQRFGRELSPSELGCYASHYKCWEWLASSDYKQAIFFEDDVLVDWPVLEELCQHDFAQYNIDFLRLFTTHPIKWDIIKFRFLSPHYHLVRSKGICFGLQAYLLTKEAAQRLVREYKDVRMPVDWIPSLCWEHSLVNYCLFPFPVIEKHIVSTIGDKRHGSAKSNFFDLAVRLLWRIRDKIGLLRYEVFKRPVLPLGPTKDVGPAFLKNND